MLLVIGVGLTVFSFVGGVRLVQLQWVLYALSGLGIMLVFVTLLGIFGIVRSRAHKILLFVSAIDLDTTCLPHVHC